MSTTFNPNIDSELQHDLESYDKYELETKFNPTTADEFSDVLAHQLEEDIKAQETDSFSKIDNADPEVWWALRNSSVSKVIVFGEYFTYDGVPEIELIVPKRKYEIDLDDDVCTGDYKKVYLSVAKRRSFQISMGRDGYAALGSTPTFDFDIFANTNLEYTAKYVISCVAMDAIRDYTNNAYGHGFIMPCAKYDSPIYNNEEFDKFIDNVYKFVRNEPIEEREVE